MANPSESRFLVGSVVRHNLGYLGKILKTEHVNNRVAFHLDFKGDPFHGREPWFFLNDFERGTLEFITVSDAIKEKLKGCLAAEKDKETRARAKKRLSLIFRSENLKAFSLPESLQDFIAKQIGWEYAPIGIEYQNTDEVRISQYLGTYFPRSFSEAYSLFSLLLQKAHLISRFLDGDRISIIDIGSGTGGNLFGFLWALKDRCLVSGYSFPNIEFTAVEKNEQALDVQIRIMQEFFPDQVDFKMHSAEFLSGADFLKNLTDHFPFEGSVDLIMCWKFVCEFYNSIDKYMKNNEMYGNLLNIADRKLKPYGILAICDVTKRAYDPDGNFLPNVMNREVQKVLISEKTDPAPIIPHLPFLDEKGIGWYIQFTVNDYEAERFEPNVPGLDQRIDTFAGLSEKWGKERVIWRFDPLIRTDKMGPELLLEKIERIGERVHPYTEKLVISFADISTYAKVKRNLKSANVRWRDFEERDIDHIAQGVRDFCGTWNLEAATCGESIDLSRYKIRHNRCVDDELMMKISGKDLELARFLSRDQGSLFSQRGKAKHPLKDKGQRKACGCIVSKDIGQYDTCKHLCVYCYANTSPSLVEKNRRRVSSNSESILGA